MKSSIPVKSSQVIPGHRFLLAFMLIVVSVAMLIGAFNHMVWRMMLLPQNQTIVQLLSGWSREFKPILFDRLDPQVAVFGASWARDAFDPQTAGGLTGQRWFNHAVSAATPYEARRFVESSLDAPHLDAVILNLDTFLRPGTAVRRKQGFDETLLDQDSDGHPTRWLRLRREFMIALSGAALGNSIDVLRATRARDAGADPAEYLESYQRFDYDGHEADIEKLRRLLPRIVPALPSDAEPPLSELPAPPGAEDFERTLAALCRLDIEVYGYFTPSLILVEKRNRGLAAKLYGLGLMRKHVSGCRARLHLFDFNYVNGVTLDGLERGGRFSEYFRPDGHPRPSIGLLMIASMFGKPFPAGTPPRISREFGVDLLPVADAEMRLRTQSRQLEQLYAALGPA
ncbi:MAG: hypothetical protein OEW16_02735 [Gammaproteobacteria bacterium]|nr:hypothetical protein [Gammaproteobacteria bacterium]